MSCYQIVFYTYLVGWSIVFENVPDNFWMWVWHFDLRRRGRWIWLAALLGNFVCNLFCDFPTLGWLLLQFLITLMKHFFGSQSTSLETTFGSLHFMDSDLIRFNSTFQSCEQDQTFLRRLHCWSEYWAGDFWHSLNIRLLEVLAGFCRILLLNNLVFMFYRFFVILIIIRSSFF